MQPPHELQLPAEASGTDVIDCMAAQLRTKSFRDVAVTFLSERESNPASALCSRFAPVPPSATALCSWSHCAACV